MKHVHLFWNAGRAGGVVAVLVLLIGGVLFSGCSEPAAEHGHDHERPRRALTAWSVAREYFVDFPVPVAQEEVAFAVHVAQLAPHVPEDSAALAEVEVELIDGNGQATRVVGAPVQAGIWKGSWTPPRAGAWRMRVTFAGERVDLGHVQVVENEDAAVHAEAEAVEVALSKEQAWAMPFALGTAGPDTVYSGIRLAGTLREAPGRAVEVVAPVSGVLVAAGTAGVEGRTVGAGEVVFRIRPEGTSLAGVHAEWSAAAAELEAAEAALRRIEPLAERGTATRAELEAARLRRSLAAAQVRRLEPFRPDGNGTAVRAPAAGRLAHVHMLPGTFVAAGTALATISSGSAGFVEVQLPLAVEQQLEQGEGAWVQTPDGPWRLGRLHALSPVSQQGTVKALFEVDGIDGTPGRYTEVQLRYDGLPVACAVPESALLEQYGTFAVVVAEGGEAYRIVPVTPGHRSGGMVEITAGLAPGERIVTEGGYAVRMVAMAGSTPAHGHSH